jgi:hypothetical protein
LLDFVHPDDRHSTTTAFHELLSGQDVIALENRYLARNRSIRWLQWIDEVLDIGPDRGRAAAAVAGTRRRVRSAR